MRYRNTSGNKIFKIMFALYITHLKHSYTFSLTLAIKGISKKIFSQPPADTSACLVQPPSQRDAELGPLSRLSHTPHLHSRVLSLMARCWVDVTCVTEALTQLGRNQGVNITHLSLWPLPFQLKQIFHGTLLT